MTDFNHPLYYSSNGIEALDFFDAFGLIFALGNVVKYISRAGHKDGEDSLTALLKARFYLNLEIERLQNGGSI